jgi:hypothetical protein
MRMPTQAKPADRKVRRSGVVENGLTQSDCCGDGKCCIGACIPILGKCAGVCVPNIGQC